MSVQTPDGTLFSNRVSIPNDFVGTHIFYPFLTSAYNIQPINGVTDKYSITPTVAFAGTNGVSTKVMTREFTYWHYLGGFLKIFRRGTVSRGLRIYNAIDNTTFIGVIDYVIDDNTLVLQDPVIITPTHSEFNLIGVNFISPPPTTSYGNIMVRGMNSIAGSWPEHNPSRGVFRFTNAINWLDRIALNGYSQLFMLYGTPPWAAEFPNEPNYLWGSRISNSAPADMQYWVEYGEAVANNLNGKVDTFEVWN